MGETPPEDRPAAKPSPPAGGHGSVFLDPTGRRAHGVRIVAAVVAAGAMLLLAGFLASLVAPPLVDSSFATPPKATNHIANRKFAKARKALFQRIAADEHAVRPPASTAPGVSGAYYAPWTRSALDAFQAHAADLTHVYTMWLELSPDGRSLDTSAWNPARNPGTQDLVKIATAKGVRIVPVFGNSENGKFDGKRVDAMLKDPKAAEAVADAAVQFVVANGYGGLQVDFENLNPGGAQRLAPWLASLDRRLHATGRELSVALEADLDTASIRSLSAPVDYAVVMAYDEHVLADKPGPVASATYVNDALKRFAALIPPSKVVLGVGAYGYDWTVNSTDASAVTNQQALTSAAGYRSSDKPADVIDYDPNALEPTFQYNDEGGQLHEVWFLDASTVANAMTLARSYRVHGAALFALGMEDSSSWQAFGRNATPNPDLTQVAAPQGIQYVGDGELLRIARKPQLGTRAFDLDKATGLITDETYLTYPTGWIVQRSGAPAKTVALTFDDGPDPSWTPKVLEILKRRGVPATFFMIGQNAADHPGLVRQVYAGGNEIGSHSFTHPNMMHVSEDRVRLELTATQRALESILGRSVVLFRPPYNADSEPNSYGELMPVEVAFQAGYVTAGETIDPHDWDTTHHPDGTPGKLTSNDIVQSVLSQLNRGQAVLLHDAGGDRSQTVAALDPLITALQQRGYRFSTIGELEGRSRDQTMPKLSPADLRAARLDRVAFGAYHAFSVFLFWGFSIAIALGLARIALMISLAAGPRLHPPTASADAALPDVDVLVAAYNEAPVIAGTIRSLLSSRGVTVHVIVVDDGSQDGTGDVVQAEFADDPRVVVVRKPNGGKASALNVALASATAPVVVGVDADTQLAPDALARLAQWFLDPSIGAVAGNVRVGNQKNIVTRWQSVEYITSQNIDRRAMARLNAITVVPGAIGAWRTEALRAVGGYRSDTLAEDMDLTWRIRRQGWVIANEPRADAYTEAPSTLNGLLKQRFRWTFGTLQCLWKHRSAVFHYGWFGWLALPTLWLFQIAAQILAPLVDLQLVFAAASGLLKWVDALQHTDIEPSADTSLWIIIAIYVAFLVLEIAAGWVAYGLSRAKRAELALLPTQRFVYRQIMYVVVWRSLIRAAGGVSHAWVKLRRTGDVRLGEARG